MDKVKNITGYGYVLKTSGEFVLVESINMASSLFQAHQTEKINRHRLSTIYKSLLKAVPDMFFLLDAEGTYIDYKEDDAGIFSIPPEQFIGKTVEELLPSNIADQIMYHMREAFRTKQTQYFEHEMALNNTSIIFESRMAVVDENHVVSIVRNVIEHYSASQLKAFSCMN